MNVSSNSDIGMSGSFTPFVKLHDGFFFNPDHQPCENRYLMEKELQDEDHFTRFKIPINSFEDYLKILNNGDRFKELLKPSKIEIIEKTPEELERKSRRNMIQETESNDTNTESEETAND